MVVPARSPGCPSPSRLEPARSQGFPIIRDIFPDELARVCASVGKLPAWRGLDAAFPSLFVKVAMVMSRSFDCCCTAKQTEMTTPFSRHGVRQHLLSTFLCMGLLRLPFLTRFAPGFAWRGAVSGAWRSLRFNSAYWQHAHARAGALT